MQIDQNSLTDMAIACVEGCSHKQNTRSTNSRIMHGIHLEAEVDNIMRFAYCVLYA
jgi:hypothetical protein